MTRLASVAGVEAASMTGAGGVPASTAATVTMRGAVIQYELITSILMFGLNIFVRLLTFLLIFDSVWCNIKMSRIFIIYIFSAEIIMLMHLF